MEAIGKVPKLFDGAPQILDGLVEGGAHASAFLRAESG